MTVELALRPDKPYAAEPYKLVQLQSNVTMKKHVISHTDWQVYPEALFQQVKNSMILFVPCRPQTHITNQKLV